MNIETELTPNPETLKFIVGNEYINQSGIEIKNEEEAEKFKFAKDFFQLKGVQRIFIGENFVAVTKEKDVTWNYLKTKVLTFMLDYISSNKIIIEKQIIKKLLRKIKKIKFQVILKKLLMKKLDRQLLRMGEI